MSASQPDRLLLFEEDEFHFRTVSIPNKSSFDDLLLMMQEELTLHDMTKYRLIKLDHTGESMRFFLLLCSDRGFNPFFSS